MAANDYALLVGISRYRDAEQFPTLGGPLNDVARVREWLTDTASGASVPTENVLTLTTTQELQDLPLTGWPPSTVWSPNRELFSRMFTGIALDEAGNMIRREGRLYLYFSGHGFSLNEDDTPSAALFSADNHGLVHTNLAGTAYAAAVKRARLFKEVVLIMDCCRDVLNNYGYNLPDFNRVENPGADTVKVYSLYAAPRRGKSQERELPDSDGKVVGLMTHAMLRALKEAPCDVAGQVAGRVLSQVIAFNWTSWYSEGPRPPAPRGVSPDQGDVYFRSRQPLISVDFNCATPLLPGTSLRLKSDLLNALGEVKSTSVTWRDGSYSWVQEIPLTRDAQQFTLLLPTGKHDLVVGSNIYSFDPRESNAIAF
jgi:hypothetical protein